ncbi:MAG: transpeptidase [Candidatus Pelagibacter sp.]|nr:transpeptidase [Candidatus Pelagibacter sp.]RPG11106.1 MAG: transpeptidase [Pelagibacteraceae bacterium TMED170]|tara:strand:- start:8132 stop:8620 length:489 start_codon:yes stop_codon:yes gene_type:complete
MHIKLVKKKLYFDNYKVKCSIGKRGISNKKKEGDKCTPRGNFKFKALYYRIDRIKKIKSKINKIIIKKNMGWCNDINSKYYNKLIKFPFKYSAEKLYLKKKIYDLILVLNYNQNPTIKNKGSAIFMHLTKDYKPTIGCVAIKEKDMRLIVSKLNKNSIISIY